MIPISGFHCISAQSIQPEMTEFLKTLRNKVQIALVSSSDLVTIDEQMGGYDDGMSIIS